ncbi:hypothetical protein [Bradyrhizobium paxllaeri]|uniref:hypothetical protein n=1 Tax=Bradyrhizobium paxllaeri TaxID=190148 RepID=UPI0008107021|nr:hypothetical protein [Bradyrhizobium paxllaeri]
MLVTGGAGDDCLSGTGDNSAINFAKGDGNDVVRVDNGSGSVDFSISGYSLDDVIVTRNFGREKGPAIHVPCRRQ